jgi:hypothetical protein
MADTWPLTANIGDRIRVGILNILVHQGVDAEYNQQGAE